MDTLRSSFGSLVASEGENQEYEEPVRPPAPASIGQDERRMQVRAYNHWASLLGDRKFPAIEDLEPDSLPDFGPHSVVLDFTAGIKNPGVTYIGEKLAEECDVEGEELDTLSDVPTRSLLTRITDHYMQILANQAPIGFEAEFVNQRGQTILYRGILLPFSSDDDTIDFIYGVINWKELADARAADELLLEIDQALEATPPVATNRDDDLPLTDWADGPGAVAANDTADTMINQLPVPSFGYDDEAVANETDEYVLPEMEEDEVGAEDADADGIEDTDLDVDEDDDDLGAAYEDEDEDEESASAYGSLLKMPIDLTKTVEKAEVVLPDYDPSELVAFTAELPAEVFPQVYPELDPADMELGDWLMLARDMATVANSSEDRTRTALYDAIGRAYDFSLAAQDAPGDFETLLNDADLTVQDRAPMTPVVKLVFGVDYDKTRLTEYAAALSHAHRLALPLGGLGDFLGRHEGGLKGVVKAERRLRREDAGKTVEPLDAPRQALAAKLRDMSPLGFDAITPEGSEFALVMIRRNQTGDVVMLGEVPEDIALLERAARRLIG
ncbi:MAG: hypothetical protein ABIT16_04785 [Croceibacterium sp.]